MIFGGFEGLRLQNCLFPVEWIDGLALLQFLENIFRWRSFQFYRLNAIKFRVSTQQTVYFERDSAATSEKVKDSNRQNNSDRVINDV